MKNQELFNRTVNILVRAYQNNTLTNQTCFACAVGNIVAKNCGFLMNEDMYFKWAGFEDVYTSSSKPLYETSRLWASVFCTVDGWQRMTLENYTGEAKRQIDSTGYSIKELAQIENKFERNFKRDVNNDPQFNGLMAVVDALMEIHECSVEEVKEAKELFVKV